MSKYAFLGLFFTMLVVIFGSLQINHSSNTHNMSEINLGLESAALGIMRDSDGASSGVRARDLIAELTAQVAEKQAESDRDIVVSYKLFNKDDALLNYNSAITNNSLVHSVQYKVDLYRRGDVDENGNPKDGAKSQSSTEYRISLNKN